jgi:hypothetical protein
MDGWQRGNAQSDLSSVHYHSYLVSIMRRVVQTPTFTSVGMDLASSCLLSLPTTIPTTTGIVGIARILCILPRLPLSLFPTSVDQNAEAFLPTTHHLFLLLLRTSPSHMIYGRLHVSSNVPDILASYGEWSYVAEILLSDRRF